MLTAARPARQDDGFTLIELLLSIAILGIIGTAIVSSFLVMLSTQKRTQEAQAVSQDRQLVPIYFTDDVAGARNVATGTQTVCGSARDTVVALFGRDYDPGSVTAVPTTVAYVWSGASGRLTRVACRGTGPAATTSIARNVSTQPTVSANCSSAVPVGSTPAPRRVAITVPQVQGNPLVVCAERRPT